MFEDDERKKNIFFIVTIVLVMILSYIFFPIKHTRAPSPIANQNLGNSANNSNTNNPSLSTETKRIHEEAPELSYNVDVQYPSIINFGDEQAQNATNQTIQDFVSKKISDFRDRANKMGIIQNKKSSLNIDYTVLFLNQKLMSLKFSVYEDMANVDYSDNYSLTFNYNIAQKKTINLSDIFKQDNNYLKVLSDKTQADLMDSMPGAHGASGFQENEISNWISEQTSPSLDNFQKFAFDENGLTFYFDPNKTDFYALGTQIVTISYRSIKDYLSPTSPLASLVSK